LCFFFWLAVCAAAGEGALDALALVGILSAAECLCAILDDVRACVVAVSRVDA
jgi:hypothetical protein